MFFAAQPLITDIVNSTSHRNSSLETSTNIFLQYFLPIITAMNIPLSLTNFFVFLNTGFLNSPSALIYFNLVIVDLMNAAVGIKISVNLWNDTDHHSVEFWGKNGHEFGRYVTNFTFDANIVLVFGLCLMMMLWIELSALDVLRKLKLISRVIVTLAYFYGGLSVLHRYLLGKHSEPKRLFQSTGVEAKDIFECLLIFSILCLSIYTQARIWMNKSKIDFPIFLAASRACLIITLNVVISYSCYVAIVATRVYYEGPWNNTFTCPGSGDEIGEDNKDKHWTFTDLLLCDELYLSVAFMCLQCTVNSFILLFQRNTRNFLRFKVETFVMDVKRFWEEFRGEYPEYEYL